MTTAGVAGLSTDQVAALSTAGVAALTTGQAAALTTAGVVALTSAQITALTTAGIAAMSTGQVAAIETADVAALKTNQIAALTTAGIAGMGTGQVAALTTAQVSVIGTAGIAALSTGQVAAIGTADVAALKTNQIAALTTAGVAGMTTGQVAALTTAGVAALTTGQVAALATAGVAALTSAQITALTTAGIAAMGTGQVAAIGTADVAALKTNQIAALTTAGIASLTTSQVAALSTAGVATLSTAQVVALSISTSQLAALTTNQLDALSVAQYCVIPTSQRSAFTTDQISHLPLGTPIILDLNGDGVKTLSISSGVKFDLFAEGKSVNTGWVSSGDGLLVLDRNGDGTINDGSELFGSSTKLANGQKASDGYAALKELDTNGDGVISSDDAQFAQLRVWVDSNSDGVSQTGEMKTLASLGISSINAQAKVDLSIDNGNLVGLTSSYQTTDGATHAAADVWFVADKNSTMTNAQSVDNAIAALGSVNAVAAEVPVVADLKAVQVSALVQESTESATPAVDANLRTRVSSLAQAMGAFSGASAAESSLPSPRLDTTGSGAASNTAASLTVVSMVDVMKQFDANGSLIGSQATTAASLGKSLTLPGIQDPATNGFLTVAAK